MNRNADTFTSSARGFVAVVAGLVTTDYDRPALGEWDVRALVGHTSRALATVETYLASGTGPVQIDDPVEYFLAVLADPADTEQRAVQDAGVAERGREAGAKLGPHPARQVADVADRVIALVEATPLEAPVASPAGTITLGAYLPTRTLELAAHTLDLCRAVGADPPPELDAPIAATLELVGRIAARRQHRAELLLLLLGRGSALSAL